MVTPRKPLFSLLCSRILLAHAVVLLMLLTAAGWTVIDTGGASTPLVALITAVNGALIVVVDRLNRSTVSRKTKSRRVTMPSTSHGPSP